MMRITKQEYTIELKKLAVKQFSLENAVVHERHEKTRTNSKAYCEQFNRQMGRPLALCNLLIYFVLFVDEKFFAG